MALLYNTTLEYINIVAAFLCFSVRILLSVYVRISLGVSLDGVLGSDSFLFFP
ncbi:hypothetical protein BS47DRAFT_1343290 [Hydnum rufescens UP504]|uniref:Uncharacterized protein n=1 Tax=Hydnum rufescens UP504 TaxID=1448309 RepID=A0A9P6AYS7_9AGAM|nr:hypothetical protein BS47DRAFT_1343290 [Hydnum rufescens UP504]